MSNINSSASIIGTAGDPSNFPIRITARDGSLLSWVDENGFLGGNFKVGTGGSGTPAGSSGDIQFNANGVFGNANSLFTGAIVGLDSNSNLIIDLSIPTGGLIFTVNSSDIHAAGNISFESDQGDISFTASTGRFNANGAGATFTATSGEGIGFDTTASPDPSSINFSSNAAINMIALTYRLVDSNNNVGLQVFANNAAAISGGLFPGNLYRNGADPDVVCIVH